MAAKKSISHLYSVLFVIAWMLAGTSLQTVQAASVRYVKPAASGSGDCSSWANACDLEAALGAAVSGDEVWVKAGNYRPTDGTDRTSTFSMKSGVALYGGFTGSETSHVQRDWVTNVTNLSGDIGAAGDNSDNSYHVVTAQGVDDSAVLDGFTVTGGNAKGEVGTQNNFGGGMYNHLSSPLLANVTFRDNGAEYGGGMYNDNSNPVLADVTFSGNHANEGGGMFNGNNSNPRLTNVTFSGNSAGQSGGGMENSDSSPTLMGVTFSGNGGSHDGGGMSNYGSNPSLTGVTFSGNSGAWGGGIANYSSSPSLTNVTFSGNNWKPGYFASNPALTNVIFSIQLDPSGGGMYNSYSSPALTNVTFSRNQNLSGGGMTNHWSNPTLTNVIFSCNYAEWGGGGMVNYESSPKLVNAIMWGNPSDPYQIDCNTPAHNQIVGGTPVISYSDIQGGYPGTGNIDADPRFIRNPSWEADGDLRLQLTSPAIDAGDNTAVPSGVTTDLLGHPRFFDISSVPDTGSGTPPIVDMGAYETQLVVYLPLLRK